MVSEGINNYMVATAPQVAAAAAPGAWGSRLHRRSVAGCQTVVTGIKNLKPLFCVLLPLHLSGARVGKMMAKRVPKGFRSACNSG